MQFHTTNDGELVLQPYEDTIEDLDKCPEQIGLSSFEKYAAHIQKNV